MGYRGNGAQEYGVQGYGAHVWAMGHKEYGVQGYGAYVWAMRYRGMGHMGNGAQRYGAYGQWGIGVWGTCMGNEVQGYEA